MNIYKLKDSPKLEDIKLIALDLDGTTLTRNGLTRRTRETLEEAISRGIDVVIATGRPYSALPEEVKKIKGLEYIIISNGAHIVKPLSGEFIYSNYVERDAILNVRRILMERDFPVEVFTEGRAYVDRELYEDVKENGSTYLAAKYILRTREPVDRIFDFWYEHSSRIENVNIQFEYQQDKAEMKAVLEKAEGITLTSSTYHNLEVGGKTTSKAAALEEVCRMKGIDMKNVMAFGDSPNDGAMIRAAGIGVAMENATDDIIEAADITAPSNDDEGVAYTIRMLLLGDHDPLFSSGSYQHT
ncbi:MAG: HAD family hydrolase [Anaerovoracaceae bacterium]